MEMQENTSLLINLLYLDSGVIYTEEEMNGYLGNHVISGSSE